MMQSGNILRRRRKRPSLAGRVPRALFHDGVWAATLMTAVFLIGPCCQAQPTCAEPASASANDERPSGRLVNLPDVPFRYTDDQLPKHFRNLPQEYLDVAATHVVTDAGATLGRVLFYDRTLSQSGTTSCASCHVQKFAFTDPRQFSVGHDGRPVKRNSMSLVNLKFSLTQKFFWDQRATGLKQQVLMPIENEIEMGHQLANLTKQLQADSLYPPLFEAAFGTRDVTEDRIATALSMFVSSIVSYRSPFDEGRSQVDSVLDDFPNFSPRQNLGKFQFFESGCAACHLSEGSQALQSNVISEDASPFDRRRPILQSAIFQIETAVVNGIDSAEAKNDAGVFVLTEKASDTGAFRVSSLRNVEVTGPYMHDGRFHTLDRVVEHYNWSVKPHRNLDPRLKFAIDGIAIPEPQKVALVEFLNTLTDRNLLADPKFSDPFVSDNH